MEVEELLERVNIVDYISQYVELEKKNDEYWGLSPFTNEKTPSFSVNEEKQRFYDFSSGCGGNLIHFIRKYNDCGFSHAIEIIKKFAGISDDDQVSVTVLESTKIAKRYKKYANKAKESKSVILPSDYMERYEFNKDKLSEWLREGISYETMKRFDVRYDSFSDRIVFPIRNYDGQIINVSGRTLSPNYKEQGLRKYTYFKPLGVLDTLFGFSNNEKAIKSKNEIILFEGAKSVMIASEWGVENTSAILTSHLNPRQFEFLIKLGVRVVFALDEDVDITKDSHIAKLKHYVNLEWVKNRNKLLSSKMSPVDAGIKVWEKLYEQREVLN